MDAKQALKETLYSFGIGGSVGDSTGNTVPLEDAVIETLKSFGYSIVKD